MFSEAGTESGPFSEKRDSIGGLGGTGSYKETFNYFLTNTEVIIPDCASEIDLKPFFSDSFVICFMCYHKNFYIP